MLTEVTDVKLIDKLVQEMISALKDRTTRIEPRKIGWPAGTSFREVNIIEQGSGLPTIWWASSTRRSNKDAILLIGRSAEKEQGEEIRIDLQFNFPTVTHDRKKGGMFITDFHGKYLLGHRGIVTRINRIPKAKLFQEAAVELAEVKTGTGDKPTLAMVVGALSAETFVADISKFATEIRRAADSVVSKDHKFVPDGMDENEFPFIADNNPLDSLLWKYRDEFMGKANSKRKSNVEMDWRHGRVVAALHEAIKPRGNIFKSQEIDLLLQSSKKKLFLFEVKTETDSQSIYTGVGQLFIHSAALKKYMPTASIKRILVLPKSTQAEPKHEVCREIGVDIIFWVQSSSGSISFSKLDLVK